ncbi:MAG: DNA polymerase III subunit delta [Thermodesulfovibrionales bacterium]
MSYRNFLDEVRKGLPAGNYLFTVSDRFLQTEAISCVKRRVPAAELDFNFHVFDLVPAGAERTPFEQILDVLNTPPFFTGRKFVIVENSQKLLKQDAQKLGRYLANPSPGSVLLLFCDGAVKKDLKDALGRTKQIPLDLKEREMPLWLIEKAKEKGYTLNESTANYLLGIIGPDLGMLSSEIEKLMLIGKKEVGEEEIDEIVEAKRSYSAFALVDALRARDAERALRICRVLLETEEPFSILGALNWQYSQFLAVRKTAAEREKDLQIFRLLSEADGQIKSSGGICPLELLLMKLLKQPTKGSAEKARA